MLSQKNKLLKKISLVEKDLFDRGYTSIIGIDEVGRGAWAGPFVIGAFKLQIDKLPKLHVGDSKIISKKNRLKLYYKLHGYDHNIFSFTHLDVDTKGLGKCFKEAVYSIAEQTDDSTAILVDGNIKFRDNSKIISIIDGDANIYSIACASIIAKYHRDEVMMKYAMEYAGYGFESHVGYGTKKHREAIKSLGVCDIHRKSYKPLKLLLNV